MPKLIIHIKLESDTEPDRKISSIIVKDTLEDIISKAVQSRFPEYDVKVGTLEADWPSADYNFPKIDISDYETSH